MSRIPQSFIDELLYRTDIVEVIDQRVKLKKAGKNYSACCPFHEEKTPSFTVSPDKQFYYCFGCGATGNAVGFVMEYDRQGFVDAVENLAKLAAMEVPRENNSVNVEDSRQRHLYRILKECDDYYQQQLKHNPQREPAVRYLQQRGLSGQIAKLFGLGLAAPGGNKLLNELGGDEENRQLLVESGMLVQRDSGELYDRFRNRIIFPILDTRGRTIGFGGRVLDDSKPKYLNSPETPVFHKSRELYGLYQARQANRNLSQLLVVEGYMDVIALTQYGITHAVATLGTACGEEHLRLAFRYVNDIVFCFDGDHAGRTAAKRALVNALTSMEDGRQIRFLFLPEGQDPDSLVRHIGRERFLTQVANALPLEEFLFDSAAEGIDINSMEGRARFSKVAAPLLNKLPMGVYRELMFSSLAKRTGLSAELIQELTKEKLSFVEDIPSQPSDKKEAEPDLPAEPAIAYAKTPPAPSKSSMGLNPVKIATILLLEQPSLLHELDATLPEPDNAIADNHELHTLYELVSYIRKRPNSNFNSILGYWGGAKGLEAQHQLATLAAKEWMAGAREISHYNSKQELQDCFDRINLEQQKKQAEAKLALWQSMDLNQLSDEDKQAYREMVKQKNARKKHPDT